MQTPDHLLTSAMDWRQQLRVNERHTYIVIGLFIFIYLCVGFLGDLYFAHPAIIRDTANNGFHIEYPTIPQAAHALITFKTFPAITLFMGIAAVLGVLITFAFHNKIMLMGTQYTEVTHNNPELEEKKLYNVVEEMKVAAGLRYMPKIFILNEDYMNAFASGYSEKSAMIAVTRGLLMNLNRSELQAVVAHELSHIRHHDIKLTLMATVLSNFTLLAINVLFWGMLSGEKKKDSPLAFAIFILRFLLPLITVVLLLYLSRVREYMADAGCVELMRDNAPLGSALLKIHQDHQTNQVAYWTAYANKKHEQLRITAYLYDPSQAGIIMVDRISYLFSTHPSLESRLEALGIKASQK